MGTFTKAELFKTVRIVEIEGKLDEIVSTEKNQTILDKLVEAGIMIDLGFKFKFTAPPCPMCGVKISRATITDENDVVREIRLFCPPCLWTEEMPK